MKENSWISIFTPQYIYLLILIFTNFIIQDKCIGSSIRSGAAGTWTSSVISSTLTCHHQSDSTVDLHPGLDLEGSAAVVILLLFTNFLAFGQLALPSSLGNGMTCFGFWKVALALSGQRTQKQALRGRQGVCLFCLLWWLWVKLTRSVSKKEIFPRHSANLRQHHHPSNALQQLNVDCV